MIRLLIDADVMAFRATSAAEVETEWDDDNWSLTCDHKLARQIIINHALQVTKEVGRLLDERDVRPLMCFSDPNGTWRKWEYPAYKANRKSRKPLGYRKFVDWCREHFECLEMAGLEADDVMGIEATKDPAGTVVATIDKDLATIPCSLYNWDRPEEGIREITKLEANRFLAVQAMTGDTTDNYPGVKGVGPVAAQKVVGKLHTEKTLWSAVLNKYLSAGLTKEDMIQQARLARICRKGDWNSKKQIMKWKPKV
jgi:DNA polymerase I